MTPILPQEIVNKMLKDQKVRRKVIRESHLMFFCIHFRHYIKYPTADFQREIFALTEDEKVQNLGIVAFRGSAKSSMITLSYVIWSILGVQQKKLVVILGRTQQQAKQYLKNIKSELESNYLLRADLGPIEEHEDEWHSSSLVLPQYGARIVAASTEQSIRGIRHGQYRPDLIIADDLEDLDSVKTRESRDKLYNWLMGEVIPAGDKHTRFIIVGNLLHEDSLIMRVKKHILEGSLKGVFKTYPLITTEGVCLWPGKYPNAEELEIEKNRIGDIRAWHREFLLHILPDYDKVVHREWIKYYKELPQKGNEPEYRSTMMGVDLAISQTAYADYTAMVAARIYGYGDDFKIYILPNPVNERLTHLETLERIILQSEALKADNYRPEIFVEDVGYQGSVIEHLKSKGLSAYGFKLKGQDKRARLTLTTHMIQNGHILFPDHGVEDLIQQLVGFGSERHDDLADAFSMLILAAIERRGLSAEPRVIWIDNLWRNNDLHNRLF